MSDEQLGWSIAFYIAVAVAMYAEVYRHGHGFWRAVLYGAFWPVCVLVVLYWAAYFLCGGE